LKFWKTELRGAAFAGQSRGHPGRSSLECRVTSVLEIQAIAEVEHGAIFNRKMGGPVKPARTVQGDGAGEANPRLTGFFSLQWVITARFRVTP
jgi:hypothetical protein